MTQASVDTWTARIQAKLMAAIDAAWASIDGSDDPVVIRKARDKAKACGELAAMARKVAAMRPGPKPLRPSPPSFPPSAPETQPQDHPNRKLDRLNGGGRGRL